MNEVGKYNAAKLASRLVKDGMVIGIGSGSTVEIFLNLLGERIKKEEITVYGFPSSYQSHILAVKNGLKVVDFFEYDEADLCIDGADQVDPKLNCIKGGGAAMTREKIIACASKKVIIIVDDSKLSEKLNREVPVEIMPFAYGFVLKKLKETKKLRKCSIRMGKNKFGPLVTDNGNFILDCNFGTIIDTDALEKEINAIPGVIENGIFPSKIIDGVIVGSKSSAGFLKKVT